MNKTAIKNFAVRARNKLIEDITQKAYELGITNNEIKDIETFEGGFKIKNLENSKTYKAYEVKQREKLISNIKTKGFHQVIEEVAYTWFNRFIALRFMEVNEYLPTGIRVLSSIEEGKTEPDIIKEALSIDLDIDKEIVYRLIDKNDTEDLYKYLLIKQCNELGKIMPMVFEEIADYTELLLPDNLLAEGSVIRDLVESVDEEDYTEEVEIIGWMYQYYISEKKDEVFADLRKNKKITKENIPAATQLFTPKWIVKYMVENSLGRLWLESHPDEELKAQWKYYLEEAEQDPEVQQKLDELQDPNLNPEDIKVLDPSMGSGHILVYAFDVLYDIYLKANYSERDIPQLILEKNLYGLDIDDRAGQLAAFALMMKARSKNRRIFRRKIELNICSIQESNGVPKEAIDYFCGGELNLPEIKDKEQLKQDVEYLIEVFNDAKEYGSILDVKKIDFDAIENRLEEIRTGETLDLFELQYKEVILEKLPPLLKQGRIMSEKYDVVCTNPPYMGRKSMNKNLIRFVDAYYENSKLDIYTVFIEKCRDYTKKYGYSGMITQHSWMFLSSFERLRNKILNGVRISTLIHLGARTFEEISGEVVQSVAFVLNKSVVKNYKNRCKRLVQYKSSESKETNYFNQQDEFISVQDKFKELPSTPIAYWASDRVLDIFHNAIKVRKYSDVKAGISTTDNNLMLRLWFEVTSENFGLGFESRELAKGSNKKWFPYNKGGTFRKWYGNQDYVVNWWNDGEDIRTLIASDPAKQVGGRLVNLDYMFKYTGLSWSSISSGELSVRYFNKGCMFDSKGPSIFVKDKSLELYILGILNSKISNTFLSIMSPTLDFNIGPISNVPLVIDEALKNNVNNMVKSNLDKSKLDWDSFETSWDFKHHPLLTYSALKNDFDANKIATAFNKWTDFTNEQFEQLKANEEELNRIFIDIYGLQDEVTPEVEEKDVTISKADRVRDIKSFISYAVGCMFGRYSLDEEGLAYAGGEFDINKYKTFIPTKDNVLVIADDDYFEDDIVNRFVDFVKITFGEDTLEENLDYIAETLDKKANETSRQAIRRYFLRDFYKDHVRTYSKRPIYWLVDSGRQNGFKALIYMHRYDSSTVARVRTDYLHKLQKMYESEVNRLDIFIESDLSAREKAAARKKKDNINKQIEECLAFDQVIAHVANQKIDIDLDDGVKINYEKFQEVEVPQGEGKKPLKANLLAKI